MRFLAGKFVFILLCVSLYGGAAAQAKRTKRPVEKTPTSSATPQPTPESTPDIPVKGNTYKSPGAEVQKAASPAKPPAYFYEFTRPGFSYGRIVIEHDEDGKGKISFLKDGFDAMLTDPIQLTAVTLANINEALTALNFLDSTEDYQYSKDYSHLGNMTLTVKLGGKSRTAKYNWTENKNAKALADEYRRISNEYTWKFEITMARENQPLETPRLVQAIDDYVKRGEISDPPHLLPFLNEIATDERIPLIGRNRASTLVEWIDKHHKK